MDFLGERLLRVTLLLAESADRRAKVHALLSLTRHKKNYGSGET